MDRRERLRKLALETIDLAKVRYKVFAYHLSLTLIQGSVHLAQPPWLVRMPFMSDASYK